MKKFSCLLVLFAFLFSACSKQEIAYEVANNYYVNSNVEEFFQTRFDNGTEFYKVFSMASVSGQGEKPTKIDFNHQSVIAVVLPLTNQPTEISPVSLVREDEKLVLSYKAVRQEPVSYTMRPSLLLIVDKAESGEVVLKEVQ